MGSKGPIGGLADYASAFERLMRKKDTPMTKLSPHYASHLEDPPNPHTTRKEIREAARKADE